jgi:chemotaxis protein methyltransferase CheR
VGLSPDILAGVMNSLANRAGLAPPAWVVQSRVADRMAALGVDGPAYLERLAGQGELEELIEAVRVGETRLFRHRSQVAALGDVVVPALRASGRRSIRVWSAGCAAGDEPYTLAIVLARLLPGVAISILATDVSADALEVARGATYPLDALDDVPAEWRDGFVVDDRVARVRPELVQLVRFERRNLADGDQPRGFDLVWCRNVLIYFTPDARRRAIQHLVSAVEPGGYLFVGYSETLRDVRGLDAVRSGDAVCYRRTQRAPTPVIGVPIRPTPPRPSPPLVERTPPPQRHGVIELRGTCDPVALAGDIAKQLATPGLARLTIDLDGADLIPDDVAPVLRRARTAGVAIELRATRAGAQRWLRRHDLDGAP